MADHITLDAGSGGATIAADDIGGVHYQLIKLGYGALDSFTIVTASAGLPVAQQGTWTVTGAGGTFPVTDSGGSLTVDAPVGTPVFVRLSDGSSPISTLPVSAASLPLPTGAATEAKQPALGTAGTASTDVLTVQGIASMTALKVDGSAVTQPVSGTFYQATQPVSIAATVTVTGAGGTFPVTDNSGSLTVDAPVGTPVFVRLSDGAAAITTLPVSMAAVPSHAVTNAGTFAVQVDGSALTSLQLIDDVVLAESSAHASGDKGVMALSVRQDTATALATSGQYQPLITDSTGRLHCNVSNTVAVSQSGTWNLAQMSGVSIAMDTGVRAAGVQRVTICTDDVVPASQSGTWNITTLNSVTQFNGQNISMGTGTRDAGTQRVTIATNDTVPASQSGTWTVQPGNTANTTPWLVTDTPATSGGLSSSTTISTGATNQDATVVKASQGQVYGYALFNTTSSARFVKFYNLASGATSASTPFLRVYVPPTGGANVDIPKGIACGTGIMIRITTGAADNDTGACSTNDVLANVFYK